MIVYINKVYLREDLISYLQVIMHDEVNLKNIYYTEDYDKVVAHCRDLKNKGHKVLPLLSERFEIDPSVEKIKIDNNFNIEVGFKEESFIDTVYSLYSSLSRYGAVLISDDYVYEDGYIGLLSEFSNLDISNKNMEVTLPIIYNNKIVDSFKLITQKEDVIYNNKFKAAVPKKNIDKFCKYGLKEIGEISLNNTEFVVVEYLKNLTIFRVIDFIEVPEPIIVRYVSQHDFYTNASVVLKNVLSQLNVGFFKMQNSHKLTFSDLFNNYSGVFLRSPNQLPKGHLEKLVSIVLEVGPTILGDRNIDNNKLVGAINKILAQYSLPKSYGRILFLILNIYRLNDDNINVANSLMMNYHYIKLILLDIDLYLYNLRLNIFNNCKELYPGKSQVVLKSYGVPVKMEIWKK